MYTSEQLKRYLRGEQTVSYSDNPAPTVSEGAKAGTSDELKQYLASIHYPASEPAAAGGSFFRRAADTVKSIATPENAAYTQQMKAYDTALAGIERQMADLRDSALQEGTARYLVGEGNFTSDGSLDRYQELGAQKQAILRERENLNLAIRAVEFAKLSDSDAAKLEEILSFENWWTEDQSGYIAAQGGMSPWAQPTAEYRERESRVNQYREELKQKYNYDFLHDYYTRVRNEKKAVQEQQKWQEYVNQGPVEAALANLISVPMGLAGGAMGTLDTARQRIGKEFSGENALPIDANSQYYGLTKAANAIREQTAQNIDNGAVGFLYQTGMSGLDSLAASLVPGGAVLLATNAGTSGFLDAKARGASDDEAIAMGIASGVFEGLFESVSLGKLADTVKKAPKTFRGLVKDGLVSMGVNASEETFTEIADVLADSFIMGDLSEYNLAVKSYREAGLSEEEAKNRAARDTFGQIVTAGLGGAVMGGAFTGVGSLTGNINSRRLTQAARGYESLANANASLLGTTAETNAQQVKQVSDFLTATTADNGQTAEYTEQAVNARDNIGQWLNNLSAISESNLDQQVQSNVQALRPQLTALYNYAAEKAAAVGSSEANNYAIRRIAREVLSDIRKENLPESHAENVEGFLDSVQGTGMNPDTVTQLAQLARQISLPIRADESLGDGIRAAYDADTKTIYINPNAVTTALSAAHELAHATELLEEYPEMKDYILRHAQQLYGKSLSELVAEKQEQYSARAGQALTREEAELEIVAGVFDNILTDERFLRRLYTADRGLFYRLYRFVRYQLERMSNSIRNGLANPEERSRQNVLLRSQYMMENLVRRLDGETALRRLRTTAEAQAAQMQSEQRRSGSTFLPDGERNETQAAGEANSSQQAAEPEPYFEGGINHPDVLVANIENRIRQNNEQQQPMSTEEFYRFLDEQNARLDADRSSRRRRQYSLNEKFKDEYDAWDKKTEGRPFYIGNTSDALESVGVRDYGFYWDKSKIVKIKEKHPDMTDDVIKRVPEILENPVLIMESLTVPGRITLYGEVTDAKGIPVLVAVELNPSGKSGRILNMAKIASAYGRKGENATQSLIDRSTILYIDPNKNRTDNWSRALRLQLPTGLTSYGPINTIAQRATGVNNQSMQNRAEHAQPRRKFSAASQEDIENLRDGRYTEDRGEENGRQAEVRLSAARGGLRSVGSGSTGRLGDENLYAGRGSGNNGDGQRNREVAEGAGNSLLKERFHGKEYTYKVVKKENASPRARQIAEEFEKLGITPIIVDGSVKELRNGKEFIRNTFARSDGKVFISNQISDQLASMAVPHESIHQMMFLHPELYQSVKNALIESGITMQLSDGSPHPILKSLLETYRNNNPEFSNLNGVEKMYNELLAQISGYHAADPELARKMFGTLVNDYDNVLKHILSSLDKFKKAQAENSPQRENAGGSSVPETHVKYSKKENRASALAASNATIRPSEEGGQNPVDTSTLAQRATGVNHQSMQNQTEHAQPRRKLSAAEDTKNIENLRDGRYTEDKVEENGGQAERTPETAIEESWNYNEQTDRRRDKDNTGVRESGLRNHAGYLNRGPQESTALDEGRRTASEGLRNENRERFGEKETRTQNYRGMTLRYRPTSEAEVEGNARQARDGFAEYGIQAEIVDRIETDRGGGADDFNRSGNVSAATTPDGKILIYNTEGSNPENVVNHELVHYMRRNASDLYQAMVNTLTDGGINASVVTRPEGQYVKQFINDYERLHPGISLDTPHFYEELLSYVSGLHAQDPEFARQVFGTFIRDYDAVVDAITSSLDRLKKAQAENSPQRENAGGSSVSETHVKYSVAEDGRLSRFFTSVLDSKNIPEDYKARIREDAKAFYYEVEHNEDTLKRAVDRVLEDPDRALARFLGKSPRQADRTDIAVGMVLQSNLLAQKDYAGAVDVTEKLQKIGTQAGQSVQAFTFLNRMTPNGMVYYVSGTLDKVYNELSRGMGRKAREKLRAELRLTPVEAEYIYSLMQAAGRLPPGRERDVALASVNEFVGAKIPARFRDKLKSWLRISMLLNPKTMIRNVMSNVLMYPAHMVSDVVGSAIDRAVQRIGRTGVRTTGVMSLSSQLSGARKGAFESFDDFRRHINTRGAAGRYEIRREGTPFNRQGGPLSRALAKVDSVTGFLLDAGDRPFFEAYFINSLNNQLRLNNVTEPTAEMTDIATTEALQRTWQDDNGFTKAFSSIRRVLNFGGDFGLGTIAVPFTKTPANLVKALVDFSPFGLIRGLTYDIAMLNRAKSNGEGVAAAQRRLVRDVANSFVGTLLMMTGYVLAANGVVTGSGEDDRDAAAYSRDMMGISPYSFILGDGTSVSYDWAAPIGTLIGIGADVKKELGAARDSGDDFVGKLLDVLGVAGTASVVGANTLFEQSLFTGIRDLFGGTYGTIPEGILGTALNLPSQFVPTFLSQIAQALDPYQRVQYVKGNELQSTLNEVIAKIPGLRNTLEIKRNNFGGYVNKNSGFTTIGAGTSTILNTFLNPANVNTKQPTELQKQLWELYEKTGNEAIFPSTAPDSFSKDGKKYTLSPEQKVRYLDLSGEYYTQQADKILDSHRSNEEKAAELADLVTKSRAYAKEELIKLMEEDD